MDILWGALALLLLVGSTAVALAVRREDPSRPWFPAGSDDAARADGDRVRQDADLRAADRQSRVS